MTRAGTLLLAALAAASLPAAESAVVRIGRRTEVVSAPKGGVDLGRIDQHRVVDCSFAVTNGNWRPRRVLGVKGNCACLDLAVEPRTLACGEACPVKVLFNPAGMEGPVEKLVTVRLEGGDVEYPIRADVRLRLGLHPSDAQFGVVASQDGGRARVCTLAGFAAEGVRLALVPPANSFFDVRLVETNGVLAVVAALPAGPLAPGLFAETWRVRTGDPEIPEVALPVGARVAGGLRVSPRTLAVPREGPPCVRTLLLRPDDAKGAFAVLSAETKPRRWADVEVLRRPLGGWLVRLSGIDPAAVRQFSKKPYLEVKTDWPGLETLAVPLDVAPPGHPKEAT